MSTVGVVFVDYNCLIFWNGSMSQFKLVMPSCKTTAGFINCFP